MTAAIVAVGVAAPTLAEASGGLHSNGAHLDAAGQGGWREAIEHAHRRPRLTPTPTPKSTPTTPAPSVRAAPTTSAPASPSAASKPVSSGSGSAMPVGDLPGWHQVLAEDFNKNVPLGQFPGSSYSAHWTQYDNFSDSSGVGRYEPSQVVSVSNGVLDMFMHTLNGTPVGAAPVPLVTGSWGGQTYGRFSVRFKSDAVQDFGAGFLLWPDDNNWNEGELDFAEGGYTGTIHSYAHCIGNPSNNCLAVDTGVPFTGWHTATVDWKPGLVTFYLDGKVTGTSTASPTSKLHMVLQSATTGTKPPGSAAGHVDIDWVTIYSYVP